MNIWTVFILIAAPVGAVYMYRANLKTKPVAQAQIFHMRIIGVCMFVMAVLMPIMTLDMIITGPRWPYLWKNAELMAGAVWLSSCFLMVGTAFWKTQVTSDDVPSTAVPINNRPKLLNYLLLVGIVLVIFSLQRIFVSGRPVGAVPGPDLVDEENGSNRQDGEEIDNDA